jgi:hypothetical protein
MCFKPKVPKESADSIAQRTRAKEEAQAETSRLKREGLEGTKRTGSGSIVRSLLASQNTGAGFGSNFGGSGRNYFG